LRNRHPASEGAGAAALPRVAMPKCLGSAAPSKGAVLAKARCKTPASAVFPFILIRMTRRKGLVNTITSNTQSQREMASRPAAGGARGVLAKAPPKTPSIFKRVCCV
jgi:hypothetical protein